MMWTEFCSAWRSQIILSHSLILCVLEKNDPQGAHVGILQPSNESKGLFGKPQLEGIDFYDNLFQTWTAGALICIGYSRTPFIQCQVPFSIPSLLLLYFIYCCTWPSQIICYVAFSLTSKCDSSDSRCYILLPTDGDKKTNTHYD